MVEVGEEPTQVEEVIKEAMVVVEVTKITMMVTKTMMVVRNMMTSSTSVIFVKKVNIA